ncbi:uncharacterized [Tachysurus ichikawai]
MGSALGHKGKRFVNEADKPLACESQMRGDAVPASFHSILISLSGLHNGGFTSPLRIREAQKGHRLTPRE